jgi:hypothetical protein
VEYFSYLVIEIINCAKRTRKIKSRIYTAKQHLTRRKIFYEQFLLKLMEETGKRYVWSVSVYGVGLRHFGKSRSESSET